MDLNEQPEIDPNAELVAVEVLVPLSWDGDPDVDGAEFYAPEGWLPPAQQDGEGNPLPYLDGNGEPVVVAGHGFVTTRIQAEALVRAKAAKIVRDPA